MKVVIDIDEEDYEVIKEVDELGGSWKTDIASQTMKAVANGTPLEEVLEDIKAEIETKYGQCDICEYFENYDYEENDISEYRPMGNIADILQIINKYKAESEE